MKFAISLPAHLIAAGQYSEAEPHVRWCLARYPDNKSLKGLLLEINKHRFVERAQIARSKSK